MSSKDAPVTDDIIEGVIDGVEGLDDDVLDIDAPAVDMAEPEFTPADAELKQVEPAVTDEMMTLDDEAQINKQLDEQLKNDSLIDSGTDVSSLFDAGLDGFDDGALLSESENELLDQGTDGTANSQPQVVYKGDVTENTGESRGVDSLTIGESHDLIPSSEDVSDDVLSGLLDESGKEAGGESVKDENTDGAPDETEGVSDSVLDIDQEEDNLPEVTSTQEEPDLAMFEDDVQPSLDTLMGGDEVSETEASDGIGLLAEPESPAQAADSLGFESETESETEGEPDFLDLVGSGDEEHESDEGGVGPELSEESDELSLFGVDAEEDGDSVEPEFVEDAAELAMDDDNSPMIEEAVGDLNLIGFGEEIEEDDGDISDAGNVPHQEIDEVEELLDSVAQEIIHGQPDVQSVTPEVMVEATKEESLPEQVAKPKTEKPTPSPETVQVNKPLEVTPPADDPKKSSGIKKLAMAILGVVALGGLAGGGYYAHQSGMIGGVSTSSNTFEAEISQLRREIKYVSKSYKAIEQSYQEVVSTVDTLKQSNEQLLVQNNEYLRLVQEQGGVLSDVRNDLVSYQDESNARMEKALKLTLQFFEDAQKASQAMGDKIYRQTFARVKDELGDSGSVKLDAIQKRLTENEAKLNSLNAVVDGQKSLLGIFENESAYLRQRMNDVESGVSKTGNHQATTAPVKANRQDGVVTGYPQADDDGVCCIYIDLNGEEVKGKSHQTKNMVVQPSYVVLGAYNESRNPRNPVWTVYLQEAGNKDVAGHRAYKVGQTLPGYGLIKDIVTFERHDGGMPYRVVTERGTIENM